MGVRRERRILVRYFDLQTDQTVEQSFTTFKPAYDFYLARCKEMTKKKPVTREVALEAYFFAEGTL